MFSNFSYSFYIGQSSSNIDHLNHEMPRVHSNMTSSGLTMRLTRVLRNIDEWSMHESGGPRGLPAV